MRNVILILLGTIIFDNPVIGKTIRLAHALPATHTIAQASEKFKEGVEKRTNGDLKIEIFPSGSLVPARDALQATSKGVVEMAWIAFAFWPKEFPVSTSIAVVPFGWTWDKAKKVSEKALPYFNSELKKHGLKSIIPAGGSGEWMLNKYIDPNNPDWSGLRVRSAGGTYTMIVETLGAAAVTMPVSEVPGAVRTGVIDGFVTGISNYVTWDLSKPAPYVYITQGTIDLGNIYVINEKYFNSLSNSYQKILTEEGLKAASWLYGVASDSDKQKEIEARNLGATVIKLNSNQRRIWKKKMSPVYDKLRPKIGSKFDNWMNTVEKL